MRLKDSKKAHKLSRISGDVTAHSLITRGFTASYHNLELVIEGGFVQVVLDLCPLPRSATGENYHQPYRSCNPPGSHLSLRTFSTRTLCVPSIMRQFPGVPPIVLHAESVVESNLRRQTVAIIIALFIFVPTVSIAALFPLFSDAAIPIAILLAPSVAGAFYGLGGPTRSRLRDAEAVLTCWEETRRAWASQTIKASLGAGTQDVKEWSEAARRLDQMRKRRTS